jgi:uncharacterized membrane protein
MIRILLAVIFVAVLAVPLFNHVAPTLFGFPFFYWYQLAVVPVASVLIYLVYRAEDNGEAE